MTGEQLKAVLIVAAVCGVLAVWAVADAWAARARYRVELARERRRTVEAKLELARRRPASAPTDGTTDREARP